MSRFVSLRALWFAAVSFFVCLGIAQAQAPAKLTPDKVPGVVIVDAAAAKALADKGVKMYDVRVPADFAEERIKGAISIPYVNKSENVPDFDASKDTWDVKRLPADKSTPIIIYGNAPEGWRHYKASVLAVKAGYTRVHWLRNGIREWKEKGFPTEQ